MKFSSICAVALILALQVLVFGQVKSRQEPIAVGTVAPDFSLKDQNEKIVRLSDVGKTTILVFYRGYWCPFCAKQLAELRGLLKPGEDVSMMAISIDSTARSKELATKIARDGKGELSFSLLSDPGHKTIDAYGLFDPAYVGDDVDGIPHPAILILDKMRKVVWIRVEKDYRKRPTNAELRAELDKLNIEPK